MNTFSAQTESDAVVPTERSDVWAALTDPVLLPKLTPFLQHIHTDGDLWRWEMARIPVLGVALAPRFTEKMHFEPESRITYTHAPPAGTTERTGVEGWYALDEVDGGTRLRISLTIAVDLPLPKSSGFAVRRVMTSVVDRMGDRFAANLLQHLGVPT
jgi:carbon monoxide dehydrogenase subunit G